VLTNLFKSPSFIGDWRARHKKEELDDRDRPDILTTQEIADLKLKLWTFYPGSLLFDLPLGRAEFRKDPSLKSVHTFIQKCNDSGLLTRQEIVSMIPPLLLDVKPGMKILDTCAAPGSKTAQLLEFMLLGMTRKERTLNPGFVLANDADNLRANLLSHQSSRFNSGGIAIVNHNAVNFPTLHYQPGTSAYAELMNNPSFDNRVLFDRILCDVPCSSDAAIRKIP
jgi:16S rRNA C967 or C1407 C5-methylase (RsmB/RsmF family)